MTDFIAVKDGTIQDTTPDTLVANADAILDGSSRIRRALVAFDLSSIPVGSTVSSAILSLTCRSNLGAAQINIHRLLADWTEGAATWNSRNGVNNWSTAGGDFDATADASNSQASFTSNTVYTFTVTALVQEWIDGTDNFGLLVKVSVETGTNKGLASFSREAVNPAQRPKLTVEYTEPSAGGGSQARGMQILLCPFGY